MAMPKLQLGTLSDDFATANVTEVIGYSEYLCKAALYFGNKASSNLTANMLINDTVETEAYSSGYTFHTIITIVSGVATVLTLIFTVTLTALHLANWVKPQEQKQ